MKLPQHHSWLRLAEGLDANRVFPRLMLVAYCAFVLHVVDECLHWYFLQPIAGRTLEATALCGTAISVVSGLGTMFLTIYTKTGRDWQANPAPDAVDAPATPAAPAP